MNVEQLQERIDHLDKWAQGRLPPQTAVDFGYVLEAARLVANAKQFIRPHQSELNRELRAALGRGRLAPWERDIEALLNIAAALTPGDIERNWNDRGEMMDR